MEIKIKKTVLLNITTKISSLNSNTLSETLIPEKNGILFSIFENRVEIIYQNSLIKIIFEINNREEFKTITPGTFLIKNKLLNEIISGLKYEELILKKIEDNILLLRMDDFEIELSLLDESKYERPNKMEKTQNFVTVNSTDLKKSIESVLFINFEKSLRKILQGVNLVNESSLKVISTDSIRICHSEIKSFNKGEYFSKIIYFKIAKEIIKLLEDEGEITLYFSEDKGFIEGERIYIEFELIEGIFPDVQKIYPEDFQYVLEIEKSELSYLIDKVTFISKLKNPENILVKMYFEEGKIKFDSKEIDVGWSSISTKDFKWNGRETFNLTFNPIFFRKALSQVETKDIFIRFNSDEHPFQLDSNTKTKYINLPIKMIKH